LICYFFSWFQVFTKKAKALLATALVLLCAIAMFCKVCFDASKSDYKTHNVRDSASNVVCPLLLNTKCRTCGYFGHTTKYCKLGNNARSKAYVRPAVKVHVHVSVPVSVPLKRGAFACLDEEICEDACDDNVSPTGVEACVAEACVAEACVAEGCFAEEMDFDKDTIIWGVGLKSMIGKRWADVVGC
jgi:hypothetical protein